MGNFTYNLPFNLVNGTTADALEVMANFNAGRNAHNGSMNGVTGHGHTGAVGDGPLLSGASWTNVDVYNGFDFRAFSDAGITQTAGIDGATGNAFFLGKVAVGGSVLVVDFAVGRTTVGGYVDVVFSNADNTNPASHTRLNIASAGAGGGNPSIQWSIPGLADYSAGILNNDADKWNFCASSTLGTNPKMTYDLANDRWGFFTVSPSVDFHINKITVGGTVTGNITNGDNTNAGSHCYWSIYTGGAASGDPFLLIGLGGGVAEYYCGIDNSDSDYFKIGVGAVVGTNTAIQVQSASSVGVNPSQTSAVAPTFWVGTTAYGFSQNNNDFYIYSDDDMFFMSGGVQVASLDNNGTLSVDGHYTGDYLITGSQFTNLPSDSAGLLSNTNCTTTMARWSDGGGGGAPTLDQDFNISGISYNGAGTAYYELTIDTNLNNNSYAVLATSDSGANDRQFANVLDRQTTYYQIHIKEESGADVTASGSSCSIGGLA